MNIPNDCPFCGTHDHVAAVGGSGLYNVICPACHAVGPDAGLYDTAIARWNDVNPDREKKKGQTREPISTCPWCKGHHILIRDLNLTIYWAVCKFCGGWGPEAPSPLLAKTFWNCPSKAKRWHIGAKK